MGDGILIHERGPIRHGPAIIVELHALVELKFGNGLTAVLAHEAPLKLAAAEFQQDLLVNRVLFAGVQIFLNLQKLVIAHELVRGISGGGGAHDPVIHSLAAETRQKPRHKGRHGSNLMSMKLAHPKQC